MRLLDNGLYQINKNLGFSESRFDVLDGDEYIVFRMAVPGLRDKDVDIRVRDSNRILIKSLRASKFCSPFYYVFATSCDIAKEETYAMVKDGILTIKFKKDERYKKIFL